MDTRGSHASVVLFGVLIVAIGVGCSTQLFPTTCSTTPGRQEVRVTEAPVASATAAPTNAMAQGPVAHGSRDSETPLLSGKGRLELRDVFFGFDRATIEEEARSIIEANAKVLRGQRGRVVRIEGYCDERGMAQYNLVLGEQRAHAVRELLANQGVPSHALTVVS